MPPRTGTKEPGEHSLGGIDKGAEVSERDLKEGERRRSGQRVSKK